jgi:ABC-2 type transport system ATP-binding protein
MLTTLLLPTSGDGHVAGYDLVTHPEQVRAHIGYVPQLVSSDGNLTGYENLLMSARLYLVPRAERTKRIYNALEMMDLGDAADRLVQHYSGGMVRRLEIAQSMIHNPDVLFLDEPTVGLDPLARHKVWQHIQKLKSEKKTTIFLTTHQMDEADALCDKIGLMHAGRVERIGTPEELKSYIGPQASLDDVFSALIGGEFRHTKAVK